MKNFDLTGLIAIVTGGGSGIGLACVEALMDAGAIVGVLDRTLNPPPFRSHPLRADVTDASAIVAQIDAFAERHGRIDILVNNAGISFVGGIDVGTEEDWQRVFDVNVFGQLRVMRAALPWLRRSDNASVVMMSSCSALNGIPDRVLYSASKGAVQAMAMALATDLIGEGIRVNCVAPATVATPFVEEIIAGAENPHDLRASLEARQPTGSMVKPQEVGRAIVYLASPTAASTTGSTIVIDGGMGSIRPKK